MYEPITYRSLLALCANCSCDFLTCMCLRRGLFRMTLVTAQAPHSPHSHRTFRDVTPGPLTVTDTCIMYHLTNFEASRNVILRMRYVSACVEARVVGEVGKQWTKAIRCGVCYYSIVVNAHRVTSMSDTDIDAVRTQKKAEYAKQYRLKRKLLPQQQASKDICMIGYFHP
jgi:hypothetical protein